MKNNYNSIINNILKKKNNITASRNSHRCRWIFRLSGNLLLIATLVEPYTSTKITVIYRNTSSKFGKQISISSKLTSLLVKFISFNCFKHFRVKRIVFDTFLSCSAFIFLFIRIVLYTTFKMFKKTNVEGGVI